MTEPEAKTLAEQYFQQALRNLAAVDDEIPVAEAQLFDEAML